MNNEQPIIVGLDIGTTKIAVIAGRKNEWGKLEILGFGRSNSNGVKHGQVLNIDETIKAIRQALDNCYASNPNLEVNEVYVGIAGHHIKSLQTRGDIVRHDTDNEISQKEIDQLIADQYKTYIPAGDQIIDVIPQEFTVDNFQNISDPIGYGGVKVGANFHIITGDKNAIRNINRSVEKSGLITKDLVLQPLASSAAVMAQEDMEAGVAIVDIGGGTTDLAVFYEGILKHTAVIPFAGENITNDIKTGLGVLKTQAEQMKVQFGSAHSSCHESHLCIHLQHSFQLFQAFFCCLSSNFRIGACPKTLREVRPQLHFVRDAALRYGLCICVTDNEVYAFDILAVHVVHRIATATANANDLYYGRLLLWEIKMYHSWLF